MVIRTKPLFDSVQNHQHTLFDSLLADCDEPELLIPLFTKLLKHAIFWNNDHATRVLAERLAELGSEDLSDLLTGSLLLLGPSATVSIVNTLLTLGANVNATTKSGRTPINLQCSDGNTEVVAALVAAGANVNIADTWSWSPLTRAIAHGGLDDTVELLIENSADVHIRCRDRCREVCGDANGDWTPLGLAVAKLAEHTVELLLRAGANVKDADSATAGPGLFRAYRGSSERIMTALIEAGADVTVKDPHRPRAGPLINQMMALGNLCPPRWVMRCVRLMVNNGARIDGNECFVNPFWDYRFVREIVPENTHFWLAANNDAPMLAAELAGGLDPNMKTENGMTLLHWACAGDAPECVQLLLDAHANPISLLDSEFYERPPLTIYQTYRRCLTPIFYTLAHTSTICMDLLIANRNFTTSQVNAVAAINNTIVTPVVVAAAADNVDALARLQEAGGWTSYKEIKNGIRNGNHPREVAVLVAAPIQCAIEAQPTATETLKMLISGPDGYEVVNELIVNQPPLFIAVRSMAVEAVKVLLDAGADTKVMCEQETPLEYARGWMGSNNTRKTRAQTEHEQDDMVSIVKLLERRM